MAKESLHRRRAHAGAGMCGLGAQIVFRAPKRAQVLLRKLDATVLEIAAHVAEDVRQLQCHAEVDGVLP